MKHKPSNDDDAQSEAFIKKAREIEADGDDSKADDVIGQMAKMKPEPKPNADREKKNQTD